MKLPNRAHALALLDEWVENPNLKKHMLAVEAAMRSYAKLFKQDEEFWGCVGLLHDFDYERFPDAKHHPYEGVKVLERLGYPDEFLKAVLAHSTHTAEPRDSLLKKAIYAVDELCGFLVAVALVRPAKQLQDVSVDAVKKKLKEKSFAAKINREEIIGGANELEITLEQHIQNVLTAMQNIHSQLGL
ncbi:HDIG domain-containing protein [Candidatus Parcubacteria bacterium]|jgi:putative nucleotidyltransferase with HDIG domain|nr:MAG: HDIG domain-containing protein [Candidatus Parcubacteria bacterium]